MIQQAITFILMGYIMNDQIYFKNTNGLGLLHIISQSLATGHGL